MKRLMMLTAAGLAIAFSATVAQCQVVVSSKIDEESAVLGNIILAVLKHNKIETTYRLRLGTTPVLRKAMIAGEIDIYPEYTGNAAFFFPGRTIRSGKALRQRMRKRRDWIMTPTRSSG